VSKLAARLRPHAGQDSLSAFLYGRLSKQTQTLVEGQPDNRTLAQALARDFNGVLNMTNATTSGPTLYSPARFEGTPLPRLIEKAVTNWDAKAPASRVRADNQAAQAVVLTDVLTPAERVRLNRRLLEEAYPDAIVKSPGGVYPDTEIHTATYDELGECEANYTRDARARFLHDRDHPDEPRQVKPGEDINVNAKGELSIGGGVFVVMGINGYVTQAMFDANPDREFYVEESYPMDWMYPNLTPFGIIMQVNRKPVELTDEVIQRDHQFWSEYSDRLVGNWITTTTTAKDLCDFAEKTFLRHDYSGFKGDLKFVRDEDAQKGFSKLREAIGASIYEWRAIRNPARQKRLLEEAEFAYKQAFAFCPFSEGASRYAYLLERTGRVEDALLVLRTFQKMDPYNRQVQYMVVQMLLDTGQQDRAVAAAREYLKLDPNNPGLQDLVDKLGNPAKPPAGVQLGTIFQQIDTYIANRQPGPAGELLEIVMTNSRVNGPILTQVAQDYAKLGNYPKAEEAMRRATEVEPNSSQSWFNLANVLAFEVRAPEAVESLKKAFATNDIERAANPSMVDLRTLVRSNPNFDRIRQSPEYQALMGSAPDPRPPAPTN
jgi:tetratricopeptide (TPR) repeat protein